MREGDGLDSNPLVSRKALDGIHSQLYGWALSRCGYEPAVAEDLMQQAYVEVLSGRARFDNKSSLKTFLFGVVHNLARSRFRRNAVWLRLTQTHTDSDEPQVLPSEPDDPQRRMIWEAVKALPARQRDITELVFCRDMTIEEASQVMGITVGSGRVHYARAKKLLAEKLAALKSEESTP